MSILNILLFGVILVVLGIGLFFELIFVDLFIYAVGHIYPWLRKIAVWAAKVENLVALILLAVVLIILIILGAVLLHKTLIFLLIVFPLLLFSPSIWVYWYGSSGLSDGFISSGAACRSAFILSYDCRLSNPR